MLRTSTFITATTPDIFTALVEGAGFTQHIRLICPERDAANCIRTRFDCDLDASGVRDFILALCDKFYTGQQS